VAPVDRTPANPFPNALETQPVDISDEQMKFIEDHGSSTLSEEFYDWLTQKHAEHLLPLI
jgi:D-psicose/D-tagatose/L-ribulose 3-epimerase